MRNALRMVIVGLMVLTLTVNPAAACRWCGGWGGGYYAYAPAYYYGYDYGCGGGCGGCEVVVSDCGGCGSSETSSSGDGCGSITSCDTCDSCGEEAVVESTPSESKSEPAPVDIDEMDPPQGPVTEAPADVRPSLLPATPPQQPATVERPIEVAPLTPPVVPPAVEPIAPVTPPADPITEPAATPPATDDLFNSPELPATEPPVTEPTPPAAEADDLFGLPASEPTDPTEPAAPLEDPTADPADDLFDMEAPATTEPAPAEEAPAESEAPAEENTEDDIFGAREILREAGGLASNETRVWVDNTGHYSVKARLVRFVDGKVQLLKDNGRTTTVALDRLSERDLQFVNRQASAHKATMTQTVQL